MESILDGALCSQQYATYCHTQCLVIAECQHGSCKRSRGVNLEEKTLCGLSIQRPPLKALHSQPFLYVPDLLLKSGHTNNYIYNNNNNNNFKWWWIPLVSLRLLNNLILLFFFPPFFPYIAWARLILGVVVFSLMKSPKHHNCRPCLSEDACIMSN